MSLTDDVAGYDPDPELVQRARADQLADEVGRLRRELADAVGAIERLERIADYAGRALDPPKWLSRPPKRSEKVATLCTILSDCHFDEVVNPSEIDGRNAYDRRIAAMRRGTSPRWCASPATISPASRSTGSSCSSAGT